MLRKFTVVVGVTLSLLVVREASAIPVVATDLPGGLGLPIQPTTMDDFTVAMPPPGTMGTILNAVYFDGINYTYVHTVTPALANNNPLPRHSGFGIHGRRRLELLGRHRRRRRRNGSRLHNLAALVAG